MTNWVPCLHDGLIVERHRHRYEFSREYEAGPHRRRPPHYRYHPRLRLRRDREIPTRPFFLGCQFHPKFKSKPLEPHPIFRDFIAASYQNHLRLTPTAETESQFERNL